MKKVVLSLGLALSLFASDKLLAPQKAKNILEKTPLYSQLKSKLNKGILKVKGVEKKDFYIITVYDKRGEGNFFVTKDLKYTILGNVLDNKTKKPLRAEYPAEKFSGNKNVVKEGILFSFGNGKEDLYIVTDPECPFCQRFEKLAKKAKMGEKYKIHVIFLPLSFHKHSKDMIYYILSADSDAEKAKRFHETLTGNTKWKNFKPTAAQKAKIDAELKKAKKAVEELGAKGTPSFYDENMKEIKNRGKLFK